MKDLDFVKSAIGEIFRYFEKLGIERNDGSHHLGKYEVRITWSDGSLNYWQEDEKDKNTYILSGGSTLIVSDFWGKTTISDNRGLKKITKIFGSIEHYPCVVFDWIGWNKSERLRKGTLTSVRAMLSDSRVVSYEKKETGEGFLSSRPVTGSLSFGNLPRKLEEAEDILGIEIKKDIDFDEEVDETIKASGLEQFMGELCSLTKGEPIKM